MAQPLKPIECSAQPLSISFHPFRDLVAAGLVDGTVEVHELLGIPKSKTGGDDTMDDSSDDEDEDDEKLKTESEDEADTILSSIYVAKAPPESKLNPNMLTKILDGQKDGQGAAIGKATQGPSCRCVLFSRAPTTGVHTNNSKNDKDPSKESNPQTGGEYLFTACNGGSIRCLDSKLACSIDASGEEHEVHPSILWSVENAHSVGINKLFQLPHSSPCGPLLVTGDDAGTIRLWDAKLLCEEQDQKQSRSGSNPFDNLMKLPRGCVMSWKVNHDYITDFEVSNDGKILFATSADGTLSVFDLKFVNKKGTTRSVVLPDVNPQQQQQSNKKPTWETHGYTKSDNQEDELLSVVLIKNSQKLLVGSHQGILSIFSYNLWGDITDRFPGHPQSIDALLKIDEDTVLTGSSDGLVRAVQLMPNNFLGVLGAHDGFPVEGLAWSSGRKMLGSVSHDEYIRLWDGSFLNDDDDDDEDIGKSCETDGKGMSLEITSTGKQGVGVATEADRKNSDDEWEDMDEGDEDMDDDIDSDDSDDGAGNKSKKREKIFKTANEEFFSDL
mmetsp:Transcript_16961/g.34547  ORF Transcript_16961/g.34547 Transcript_16961/m.34547 type:complete len:555 (-) Transcript_16961:40-1704(-)